MRVLVVAATEPEVVGLRTCPEVGTNRIEVLVTGVGMVATAIQVSRALAMVHEPFDLVLNLGLCGAFDRARPLCEVVHVTNDHLSELGVEDGPDFVSAETLGLVPAGSTRVHNPAPPSSSVLAGLRSVTGVTVNTVHGHEPSIAALAARLDADVESMEGAAFMLACLAAGVPFAQVRAVSNHVERRNRAAWQLPDALAALSRTTRLILEDL